ncbi:MAG: hypothetical protein ACRBG0_14050 [Lewinella sp.]|jgi:hypothetical protein|uniref:hypothetical protein n=1 Tax=Lewinella sp. TaxID=2004506 RepID=UPI003D6B27C8
MNKCKKIDKLESKNLRVIKREGLKKENQRVVKPTKERAFLLDEQQGIYLNRKEKSLVLSWINPFS